MRPLRLVPILVLAAALGLGASSAAGQTCIWGSFDGSRINYPDGPLTAGAHATFRGIVQSHGGTIAPPTPSLTASYLAGVDVFYTSMLSTSNGQLSAGELSALHSWIQSGGTLIVTVEYSPIAHYNAMLAPYGLSFAQIAQQGTAAVVANHAVTNGVTTIKFASESEVFHGSDALLLAKGPTQKNFAVVLEGSTGFSSAGRILAFGDHNLFTDSYIGVNDNVKLAGNMVDWACTGGCPGGFLAYGTPCSGSVGTPALSGGGCPTPGDQMTLELSNALPGATTVTLFGLGQGALPLAPGCALSNAPVAPAPVLVLPAGPGGGWIIGAVLPTNLTTPADVFLQTAVLDPSAPFGLAATNALKLHLDT